MQSNNFPKNKLDFKNEKRENHSPYLPVNPGIKLKQMISLWMIVCLLTISVPAAPEIISAWSQDIITTSNTEGWWEALFKNFDKIASFGKYSAAKVVTSDTAQVSKLETNFPETIALGGQIQLAAIPLDSNDIPVSFVNLTWEAENPDGQVQNDLKGLFVFEKTGLYKITVSGGGMQQIANITVIEPQSNKGSNDSAKQINEHKNTDSSNLLPVEGWNPGNIDHAEDPENGRGETAGKPKINNNFNILAPVLKMPGRAGFDLNLDLTYNSRVWTALGQNVSYDIDKDLPAPGWSIGFGKIINFMDQGIVQFTGDGSRKFYSGQGGIGTNTRYFYGQSTDGSFINTATVTNASDVSGTGCYNRATTDMKYPDGTTVTYRSWDIPTSSCVGINTPITMVPYLITGRTGNQIEIVYYSGDLQDGRFINYIVDSSGRVFRFNYTSLQGKYYLTSITGIGVVDGYGNPTDGVERTFVRLSYKDHSLSYNYSGLTPHVNSNNVKVLSAIYYPSTNTGYWFGDSDSYSPYGMIRKVEEHRAMSFDLGTGNINSGQITRRRVYSYPENTNTALTELPEYSTVSETWDGMPDPGSPAVTAYSVDLNSSPRTTAITLPYQQGKTIEYSHNYSGSSETAENRAKDQLTFKSEFYDGSNTLRSKDEIEWGVGNSVYQGTNINIPRPNIVTHTDYENGNTLVRKSVYDTYGAFNRVEKMHDVGYGGETLRTVKTQYISINENSIVYPRLINLPSVIEVFDGANNNRVDYTKYSYDTTPRQSGPCGSHLCVPAGSQAGWSFDNAVSIGNVSSITRYKKVGNPVSGSEISNLEGEVSDNRIYDFYGNMITYVPSISSGTTNVTNYGYFGNGPYNNQFLYNKPVVITKGDPNTPGGSITTRLTYDRHTDLPLSVTDKNQSTTTFEYDQLNWRLKKTISPTGAFTVNDYDDSSRIYTQTYYDSNNAIAGKKTTRTNGMGLPIRQESLSRITQGQEYQQVVETMYDNLGRPKKTSKPFITSSLNTHGGYWSEVFYDWAGRVEKTVSSDGSQQFNYYNEAARPQGASNALGTTYRTKDVLGRERWVLSDYDRNVTEVIEPDANGTGSVATGGKSTRYEYDRLKRLLRIEQGVQERRFKYDSLGHLTHQKMAETKATLSETGALVGESTGQWSDVFIYDEMFNVSSSIDARGVKTVYSYVNPSTQGNTPDPLNRLFSVLYETTGTVGVLPSPTTKYSYKSSGDVLQIDSVYTERDVNGTPTRETTVGFDYDSLGRVASKTTTLPGKESSPLAVNYTYDSLNRITDVLYPAQHGMGGVRPPRKNVHNDYDIAGHLNGLKVDNAYYASDFVFNAEDNITSLKIGPSGTNQISESYDYNAQSGQLENQKIMRGGTALLNLSYQYQNCACSAGNSGQIAGIIDNLNRNKDRSYEYDKLGRLKKVTGGLNQTWSQSYSYDRYGNRNNVTSLGFESLRTAQDTSVNRKDRRKMFADGIPSVPIITKDSLLENVDNIVKNSVSENPESNSPEIVSEGDERKDSVPALAEEADKNGSRGSVEENKQSVEVEKSPESGKTADANLTNATSGTPFDFDGDHKADFSAWRRIGGSLPAGTWQTKNILTNQIITAQLGAGGNQIAPGDYDGDGKYDKAVWNPSDGFWKIQYSSTGNIVNQQWGQKGDAIVPADYDGDGKTDLAVWRPSTGYWYVLKSSNGAYYSVLFGGQQFGDIPTNGDYDGDGKSDIAVWRPSNGTWYIYIIYSSTTQVSSYSWGMAGDVPVPADYDGDGVTDAAVWRPSTGTYYIAQTTNGQLAYANLGSEAAHDVMVPADYDGDGRADPAVFTPATGTWTVKQSSTGTVITQQLGTKDDIPVPSAYIRRSSAPNAQSSQIPRDGHEMLAFDLPSNRITTSGFEYDAAGNQTRIVRTDGTALRFQYDAAGRLVKVKDINDVTKTTYTYGIGRDRIVTQEGDENSIIKTYYAWDGATVIGEYGDGINAGTLAWTKNYLYLGGNLLATQEKSGNGEMVQFAHPDQLGTRIVTNPGAGTSFEQNTLPFGTALDTESSGSISRRFTSYDRSDTTKLDYANNRFYDSAQGRFTTVDPIKMDSTEIVNPQSLNLFAYVENNPVSKTDPSGLDGTPMYFMPTQYVWVFGPEARRILSRLGLLNAANHMSGTSIPAGLQQFLNSRNFFGDMRNFQSLIGPGSTPGIPNLQALLRNRLNSGVSTPTPPPSLSGAGTTTQVSGGNGGDAILKGVGNSPILQLANRILHPDGITISGSVPIPLLHPGASITVTDDFDIIGSSDFGIDVPTIKNYFQNVATENPRALLKAFNPEGLAGGISITANYIWERDIKPDRRRDFFLGGAATINGCLIGCVGITRTGTRSDVRTAFNIGLSPGTGGGLMLTRGRLLGNPHKWYFGQ